MTEAVVHVRQAGQRSFRQVPLDAALQHRSCHM